MKAIGIKVNITDKELTLHHLMPNTPELGCMENIMALELLNGLMDQFIKVNGRIVVKMEMESLLEWTAQSTKDLGKMENIMVKDSWVLQMEACIEVHLNKVSSCLKK